MDPSKNNQYFYMSILLWILLIFFFWSFSTTSVFAQSPPCPTRHSGDADCSAVTNLIDFEIWRKEYMGQITTLSADFDNSGAVELADFEIWRKTFLGIQTTPTPTATIIPSVIPTNSPGELSIAICDPSAGPFSTTISNPFFPFPVGKSLVLEDPGGFKVQITSLDQTEIIAGVTTRVIEEREWQSGTLIEISRNFFVQTADGTVCYYGEDVDIYQNGQVVNHQGAWRAGVGANKPGIFMPANPVVGQKYQQEIAPGVAMDRAEHISMGGTMNTPAGTFTDTLFITEDPPSDKTYARGIGLIYDAGAKLTQY